MEIKMRIVNLQMKVNKDNETVLNFKVIGDLSDINLILDEINNTIIKINNYNNEISKAERMSKKLMEI